jgi:HD superfamily phosphohydrolase YqeK
MHLYHTCGRPNMAILEKIIYISDFIEPLRRFRDRVEEVRKLAYKDLDKAIVLSAEMGLSFLQRTNKFIHSNTQKTLDYYSNLIKNR